MFKFSVKDSFATPIITDVKSLEINKTYSKRALIDAGFTCFPSPVESAIVYIKEGSVYFFNQHDDEQEVIKLVHASTL